MSWAKIDDQFPHHPKIVTAGPIAELLHVRAICYCCRYLTDGFLPSGAVSSILTGLEHVGLTTGGVPGMFEVGSAADDIDWTVHMVEHGLWHPCKGGYQVHDFLEYNPTKQQVTAAREATNKRVQSFRQRRPSNGVGNGVTNAVGNGLVTLLPSPSPSPSPKKIKTKSNTWASSDTPTVPVLPLSLNGWGTPEALMALYNDLCPQECPAAETLSPKRKEMAKRILKAFPDKDYWVAAFKEVSKSPFLRGMCAPSKGHAKAFTANFDWFLSCGPNGIENIVSVWERKYGNQA